MWPARTVDVVCRTGGGPDNLRAKLASDIPPLEAAFSEVTESVYSGRWYPAAVWSHHRSR
ncbi:MAG: hypothetical protein B7X11_03075 [Acidobacteria bacterium 37-65-4]|nr:MAG: hypothetical protein B7X11_03075 [Acidobacteria bacterium 37-65-4]